MNSSLRDASICGVLVLVTMLAYLPALKCDFTNFDDQIYVTQNQHVIDGLTPSGLVYAWTTLDWGNWTPVTWMSLELDSSLFGLSPAAFHAVNVLWHAANVCCVYLVLMRFTSQVGPSVAVAVLFAVHPLHVESVAWVAERKDVLCAFWMLVTLLAYERYAAQPGIGSYIAVVSAMALGLLSKSMLVTLPVLLLLVDVWPLQRLHGEATGFNRYSQRNLQQLMIEKSPLFAMSLIVGLITIFAQKAAGAAPPLNDLTMTMRLSNCLHSLAWYVWKTICPLGLCAYYPHPRDSLTIFDIIGSAVLLIAISLYVVWNGRRNEHLYFGWLWFVIALLPVTGLIQVGGQAHADRYVYIPHVGLFLMGAWEANRLAGLLGLRRWLPAVTLVTTTCGLLLTWMQIGTWRTSESLWQNALKVSSNNYVAEFHLAVIELNQGHSDAAFERFQKLTTLKTQITPEIQADALCHLGWIYYARGDFAAAQDSYRWALRIDKKQKVAAHNLADLQVSHPELAKGKIVYTPLPEAKRQMEDGLALARRGQMTEALAHFQSAASLDSGYGDACNNAGLALSQLKRNAEAEVEFRRAIQCAPDKPDFHMNLAVLLETSGKQSEALEHYQTALELNPNDHEAKARLQQLRQRYRIPTP